MMYYLYLPIKLPGAKEVLLPSALNPFRPLLRAVIKDSETVVDKYIYITARHLFEQKFGYGNRPGWHTDGFLTEDLNYIYMDSAPTEIALQTFYDIEPSHSKSIQQFDKQFEGTNAFLMPDTLYCMTPNIVHRCTKITKNGTRLFVKISISKNKYNLRGNSINHLIPETLSWRMRNRKTERNDP